MIDWFLLLTHDAGFEKNYYVYIKVYYISLSTRITRVIINIVPIKHYYYYKNTFFS